MEPNVQTLVYLIVPPALLLLGGLFRIFVRRDNQWWPSKATSEGRPAPLSEDGTTISACRKAVYYFGLRGVDVSSIVFPSTQSMSGGPTPAAAGGTASTGALAPGASGGNPAPVSQPVGMGAGIGNPSTQPLNGLTISAALAHLEASLDTGSGKLNEADRAMLISIHSYLSAKLTNSDGDVNIDSVTSATDKNKAKVVSFYYLVGAVYFLVCAVFLHSFMVNLNSDADNCAALSAEYSTLIGLQTVHKDTTLNDSDKRDTLVVKKIKVSARREKIPSSSNPTQKANVSSVSSEGDSAKAAVCSAKMKKVDRASIVGKELAGRIRWLRDEMLYYPFSTKIDSAGASTETPTNGEQQKALLAFSDNVLYIGRQMADNIRLFILPMLYGIIGAYLWVIRRMSEKIKVFDFTWTNTIRDRGRIIFGVFVGMFFGYLFKANPNTALGAVTPFVIAFVGGYNVELLFTAMDKIVGAFTGAPEKLSVATNQTTTPHP
jgi:hypothetical protein